MSILLVDDEGMMVWQCELKDGVSGDVNFLFAVGA